MFLLLAARLGLCARRHIEIQHVECTAAKTLLRCWHRAHVAELRAHDFVPLIAPHADDAARSYRAAVRHDELKAIAVLQDDRLVGVAYDVDGLASASALVAALAQEQIDMRGASDRWLCEAAFVRNSSAP